MTRRQVVFAVAAGVALIVLNAIVWHREQLLESGQRLHLRLDTEAPYALVRGETIRLRYAMADAIEDRRPDGRGSGLAVVRVEDGVGRFVRLYQGNELADDEQLVHWRHRNGIDIGPENCRIDESAADRFRRAEFAEFAVGDDGTAILVGLRDAERETIDGSCGVLP